MLTLRTACGCLRPVTRWPVSWQWVGTKLSTYGALITDVCNIGFVLDSNVTLKGVNVRDGAPTATMQVNLDFGDNHTTNVADPVNPRTRPPRLTSTATKTSTCGC